MKKMFLVVTLFLSGCSFILPRPHDPSAYQMLVDLKLETKTLSCETRNFDSYNKQLDRIVLYTTTRDDPQANNLKKLQESIVKAKETPNKKVCESIVRLADTRLDIVINAWKGR